MGYNDPLIANRMYDFRGLFRNDYPLLPPLLQIVVFVGPSEMRMQDRIEEDGLLLRYHLFDIRSLDARRFQEGTLADAQGRCTQIPDTIIEERTDGRSSPGE